MATKAKERRKAPPEQLHIEGTAPPRIKAIDDRAAYYAVMRDRCELSKEEATAKQALIDEMHKHGMTFYETKNGLVVTVTSKSNVKCKNRNQPDEDDGEGEE